MQLSRERDMLLNVRDFVDEIVSQRTRKNPRFPALVAEAESRRDLARRLATERQAQGLTQTVVAAMMRTAASVVSKLEAGGDVKLSTYQRYCAVIGQSFPPARQDKALVHRRAPGGTRPPSASRMTVKRLLGSSSTPNVAGR